MNEKAWKIRKLAAGPGWLLLVALIVLSCSRGEKPAAEATAAPAGDIILVTIDTWRADAAGFAGNDGVKTPFLDSLAARGVVFANAHAHNVITLPSHTNILTGLNPFQHGVRENSGFVLDPKYTTVAERLKKQGYATGAFIAAFPLDSRFGLNQGFDVYDDNYGKGKAAIDLNMPERSAAEVVQSAVKWWQSVEGRKRFMWVHLYDPHAPYDPPEPFASEYGAPALTPASANKPRFPVSDEHIRMRRYLGEVAAVDAALSQHLAPIVGNDTTVIVTGDHGEALGDHGELTHGLFAYEATLKVPLLVVAPGLQPRTEQEFVRHIDLAPTILQRAGMAVPKDLPGQSLLGAVKGHDTYFESLSASLNRGWAPLTGIIRQRAKYIDLPLAELYDLQHDAAEQKNLLNERRRDVVAARGLLEGMKVEPKANREMSPEETAQLRSLGYVSGRSIDTPATVENDPKNLVHVDNQLHEVIDHFHRGRVPEALALARQLVAENPGMSSARELLAFLLQHVERVDEAIDVLGKLAAEGRASEAAKTQLALLLTETGRPVEAAGILSGMASRAPNAEILNGYGIALADQGRPREAVDQFRRALELDPNNAPAVQNLGIVALRMNDVRSAHDYLRRALEMNPRLPLALNSLGVVYARQNDFGRAVEAWRGAVSLDPKQYDALFNIGLVSARNGRRDEARQALAEFIRRAPPTRYAADITKARQALVALR